MTEVTGLPDGWDYEIVDHDHLEEQEATSNKLDKLQAIGYYRIISPLPCRAIQNLNRA